jgi:membrane-associated PAP2 superfamily phosphatase
MIEMLNEEGCFGGLVLAAGFGIFMFGFIIDKYPWLAIMCWFIGVILMGASYKYL